MKPAEFIHREWLIHARDIIRRVMPIVSLLIGVVGAVLMDRGDDRVGRLIAVMTLGWLVGVAAVVATMTERMRQEEPEALRRRTGIMARWRRSGAYSFGERAAVQVCLSQALFFPLPQYLRSTTWTPPQTAFLAVYGAACVVVLVDALYDRVYDRPLAFTVLMAFSGFCALQLALPRVLGLPLQRALLVSALAAGVAGGIPSLVQETRWGFRLQHTVVGWLLLLGALAAAVLLGLLGPAIPMVPFQMGIGTACDGWTEQRLVGPADVLQRDARRPAPMTCVTEVLGPEGHRDTLSHAWLRDGVLVARERAEVLVDDGSGTLVTTLRAPPAPPFGHWRCRVESGAGQVLGAVEFDVRPLPASAPRPARRPVKRARPPVAPPAGPAPAAMLPDPLPAPRAILPQEEPPPQSVTEDVSHSRDPDGTAAPPPGPP